MFAPKRFVSIFTLDTDDGFFEYLLDAASGMNVGLLEISRGKPDGIRNIGLWNRNHPLISPVQTILESNNTAHDIRTLHLVA